jgi:hypothetical protein
MDHKLQEILSEIEKVWPFKRVIAPQHLITRWNEEIGSKRNETIKEMAFTVDKNAVVTDEEMWKMMTYTATMSAKEHNPPHTGL